MKNRFDETSIEEISKVLGDCVTGSEISGLLKRANVTPMQAESSTKWRIIRTSLISNVRENRDDGAVTECIRVFMSPKRFVGREETFESLRQSLNIHLAFVGLELTKRGELRNIKQAETLTEAQKRCQSLKEKLEAHRVHHSIFKYCNEELLADNYFHAVFEAAKGVFDQVRSISKLKEDGMQLIDKAFAIDHPRIVINGLASESEKSEHKGFCFFLKGICGTFRNPYAHEVKRNWVVGEIEALEALTAISYAMRVLDNAKPTCYAIEEKW